LPDDVRLQGELMFANLKRILQPPVRRWMTSVKMTFWVKIPQARQVINTGWLDAFPDAHSRPARHTFTE